MADYDFLSVGNGSGDAAVMHVEADRSIGSTTLDVDTIVNVPNKFIATAGALLPSGLIDISTATVFTGHIDGSNLEIDDFVPGSTDTGNTEGQVVIIKPNTYWANLIAAHVMNLTGNGTPEAATIAALTVASIANSGNYSQSGGSFSIPNGSLSTAALRNLYKFSVYRNAAWTTPGGFGLVEFDTEVFDTSSNIDTTTDKGRFTTPIDGFYKFESSVLEVSTPNGGHRVLTFYKNGAEIKRTSELTIDHALNTTVHGSSGLLQLVAGDYIEVYTYGNSVVGGVGEGLTWFSGGFHSKT